MNRSPGTRAHRKWRPETVLVFETTYAEAERRLLEAIPRLVDRDDRRELLRALVLGIAEGIETRFLLQQKGEPIPGRATWLVPEAEVPAEAG